MWMICSLSHHSLCSGRRHSDHSIADLFLFDRFQKPDERTAFSNNSHRSCGVAARPRAFTDFSSALRPRMPFRRFSTRAARTGSGILLFPAAFIGHHSILRSFGTEVTRGPNGPRHISAQPLSVT